MIKPYIGINSINFKIVYLHNLNVKTIGEHFLHYDLKHSLITLAKQLFFNIWFC